VNWLVIKNQNVEFYKLSIPWAQLDVALVLPYLVPLPHQDISLFLNNPGRNKRKETEWCSGDDEHGAEATRVSSQAPTRILHVSLDILNAWRKNVIKLPPNGYFYHTKANTPLSLFLHESVCVCVTKRHFLYQYITTRFFVF
jgi:hypothetical protein